MDDVRNLLSGLEPGERILYADDIVTSDRIRRFACAVSDKAVYFWAGNRFFSLGHDARPLHRVPLAQIDRIRQRGGGTFGAVQGLVVSVIPVLFVFGLLVDVAGPNAPDMAWTLLVPLLGVIAWASRRSSRPRLQIERINGKHLVWSQDAQKASVSLQQRYDAVQSAFLAACRSIGIPVVAR